MPSTEKRVQKALGLLKAKYPEIAALSANGVFIRDFVRAFTDEDHTGLIGEQHCEGDRPIMVINGNRQEKVIYAVRFLYDENRTTKWYRTKPDCPASRLLYCLSLKKVWQSEYVTAAQVKKILVDEFGYGCPTVPIHEAASRFHPILTVNKEDPSAYKFTFAIGGVKWVS